MASSDLMRALGYGPSRLGSLVLVRPVVVRKVALRCVGQLRFGMVGWRRSVRIGSGSYAQFCSDGHGLARHGAAWNGSSVRERCGRCGVFSCWVLIRQSWHARLVRVWLFRCGSRDPVWNDQSRRGPVRRVSAVALRSAWFVQDDEFRCGAAVVVDGIGSDEVT